MTEDRLIHLNNIMCDIVFDEYLSVLNTVDVSNVKFNTAYVPLIYDLVNVFPEATWDEAYEILYKICINHHFFVKGSDGFLNRPMLGVW